MADTTGRSDRRAAREPGHGRLARAVAPSTIGRFTTNGQQYDPILAVRKTRSIYAIKRALSLKGIYVSARAAPRRDCSRRRSSGRAITARTANRHHIGQGEPKGPILTGRNRGRPGKAGDRQALPLRILQAFLLCSRARPGKSGHHGAGRRLTGLPSSTAVRRCKGWQQAFRQQKAGETFILP